MDRRMMMNKPSEYITDGMIHRWDGIQNTANGHNSSVTTWKDLIGSYDLELNDTTVVTWKNNAVNFTGGTGSFLKSAENNIDNANNKTIEVVFKSTSETTQCLCQCFYGTGTASDAIGKVVVYSDKTVAGKGKSGTTYASGLNAIADIKSIAVTLSDTPEVNKVFVNGIEVSSSTSTHSMRYTVNQIIVGASWQGGSYSTGYPFLGDIYAIRIYNRNLTGTEVYSNYLIDENRFFGG